MPVLSDRDLQDVMLAKMLYNFGFNDWEMFSSSIKKLIPNPVELNVMSGRKAQQHLKTSCNLDRKQIRSFVFASRLTHPTIGK
jgi:hypothetical protein